MGIFSQWAPVTKTNMLTWGTAYKLFSTLPHAHASESIVGVSLNIILFLLSSYAVCRNMYSSNAPTTRADSLRIM